MKKYNQASVFSSLFIIVIWYILSLALDSQIILPSPVSVLKSLVELFESAKSLKHIGWTVFRALESFVIVVVIGTLTGIAAGKSRIVESCISPVVSVFKATPIMSVILILFIWLKTNYIPVFSAFLMAFPVMFVQVLSGYRSIDSKLVQMCDIYNINGVRRLKYMTLPSLVPSVVTGAKQTLSMIWKVVIASEVITLPAFGVGKQMQYSQIQLETSNVFAWTVITIVLTVLSNLLFDILLKKLTGKRFTNVA